MSASLTLLLAAISGAAGVGLGAFGAHALKAQLLANESLHTWETAVHYHLLHALALLVLALWLKLALPTGAANAQAATSGLGYLGVSACLFFVGILLFSGSLYGLALGGPRWLGPVTPLGGLCFIVGWALLAVPAFAGLRAAS